MEAGPRLLRSGRMVWVDEKGKATLEVILGILESGETRHEVAQRYQTAAALAADLRRFVEDRPILARRINPAERAWRWCRRNPALASAIGLAAAAVLAVALTP